MTIAIIDDSIADANVLKDYLHQFSEETGEQFNIDYYEASIDFLEEFHNQYDVLMFVIIDVIVALVLIGLEALVVLHYTKKKKQIAAE